MNTHIIGVSRLVAAAGSTVIITALASMLMRATVAQARPVTATAGTAVVNRTEMVNWVADGELGLWVQTLNLKWFYLRFTGAGHGVNQTNSITFDTDGSGNIDRTSSVFVRGTGRCRLKSIAPTGGSPEGRFDNVVQRPQDPGLSSPAVPRVLDRSPISRRLSKRSTRSSNRARGRAVDGSTHILGSSSRFWTNIGS